MSSSQAVSRDYQRRRHPRVRGGAMRRTHRRGVTMGMAPARRMSSAASWALVPLVSILIAVSAALAAEPANPSLFAAGRPPDWLSQVERALVEKEYEASENGEG